jgi:transcriptional regulator with XRE-family HTH domain
MKKEVIVTTKCRECDGLMEGRKGEYKYIESGLQSVVLKDILVFHCTKCNEIVPEIPAAGVLHRVIALKLLFKKTLLAGSELRFLRKLCGYSVNDFAEIMGSSKTVISRWETGNPAHGAGTDRTVRLLVTSKLLRDLAGEPEPILKNVTPEQLSKDLEANLKLIQGRRAVDRYVISPEDIAHFSAVNPSAEMAASSAPSVN